MAPKRILMVDDNPKALRMVAAFLGEEAYEVHTTDDPEEALRWAAELQPDLVILDMVMPRMDGLEFARELRANPATHDIPFMFLSVRRLGAELEEARKLGASAYVDKPVKREVLVAIVRELLFPPRKGEGKGAEF